MDKKDMAQFIQHTFNTISDGYDSPAMRFFPESAQRFLALLDLKGDENILDVATGTGWAALAIAQKVLSGKVTGIDLSEGMLARASEKSKAQGLSNTSFEKMDMQRLTFPENHFDAAVCSFAIFFVEDMEGLVGHIASKIKPGGSFITTTFNKNAFSPLREKLYGCLERYRVKIPPMARRPEPTPDQCQSLFENAGLKDVSCRKVEAGYFLKDAHDWWEIVWNGGFRGLVDKLSRKDFEKAKAEHLEEIEALSTSEGIRLDLPILYTKGTKY